VATVEDQAVSCPVLGCGEQIDPSRLMCRRHWYRVPKQLRDQVWATWRSGQGALSREHHDAVRLAMATGQKRFRPVGSSPAAWVLGFVLATIEDCQPDSQRAARDRVRPLATGLMAR